MTAKLIKKYGHYDYDVARLSNVPMLKVLLKLHDMPMRVLGKAINCNETTLYNYTSRLVTMPEHIAYDVCEFFKIPMKVLFAEEDQILLALQNMK